MRIVVTGFGPFGDFSLNPSTVVVNGLAEEFEVEGVELITRTVDVDYTEALKCSKWSCEELDADVVIHVGVQPTPKKLMLETQSFSDGYIGKDVKGMVPMMNRCEADEDKEQCSRTLRTCIDCELLKDRLLEALDADKSPVQIVTSKNPGRYLCAYIYYCSLLISGGRCLFVHIPPFDKECTAEVIIDILRQIVIQLQKMDIPSHSSSNIIPLSASQ